MDVECTLVETMARKREQKDYTAILSIALFRKNSFILSIVTVHFVCSKICNN